jgi:exopolysaccharide/PEP-CTERM locus tyrosine autokinase
MSNIGNDDFKRGVIALADARELAKPGEDAAQGKNTMPKSASSSSAGRTSGSVKILERLRDKGMLVPDGTLSAEIRGEYRRIKRPLLSNAFGKTSSLVDQGNVIMVTSAVPGEGKTYTATNLALAFAQERDYTVLLVDCDVTKQGVSRLLGIERRRPDFTDLLASENMPIEDALLRTDVPGLVVLPAGKPHEYITEMVASQRMEFLVNEFATRYSDRIVVMDAPPMISTPEASVLAGLVGQIVFVIEAGKTPYAIVRDALDMLPTNKAIGLVLNKSESISNRGGYYYNYYVAYGESKPESGEHEQ